MPVEHEQAARGGLSRRQLLTRGAVAGGLVWAAPVIRSTAAYATTANGTERPCTNFFMVVIDPAGHAHQVPPNHDDHSIPPAIRQWFSDNPEVTVQFPPVPPLLTQTDGELWAVLLPEVTGPNAAGRQCRMVLGWARKGSKYSEGYIDPNPQLAVEVGRRLLFPCADQSHGGGGDDGDDDNHGGGGDGDDDDKGGGGGGDSDDDNKGGGGDGDTDDKSGGDKGGGDNNGDDGGCKNGHDDGDHDKDDTACDAGAIATAEGTTGTGTADAVTVTGTANSASDAVGSQITSDGTSSANPISGDGNPSTSNSSDGHPSTGGDGKGKCIDAIYVIYCCPQ